MNFMRQLCPIVTQRKRDPSGVQHDAEARTTRVRAASDPGHTATEDGRYGTNESDELRVLTASGDQGCARPGHGTQRLEHFRKDGLTSPPRG